MASAILYPPTMISVLYTVETGLSTGLEKILNDEKLNIAQDCDLTRIRDGNKIIEDVRLFAQALALTRADHVYREKDLLWN